MRGVQRYYCDRCNKTFTPNRKRRSFKEEEVKTIVDHWINESDNLSQTARRYGISRPLLKKMILDIHGEEAARQTLCKKKVVKYGETEYEIVVKLSVDFSLLKEQLRKKLKAERSEDALSLGVLV